VTAELLLVDPKVIPATAKMLATNIIVFDEVDILISSPARRKNTESKLGKGLTRGRMILALAFLSTFSSY
jgi:hypothetical protein